MGNSVWQIGSKLTFTRERYPRIVVTKLVFRALKHLKIGRARPSLRILNCSVNIGGSDQRRDDYQHHHGQNFNQRHAPPVQIGDARIAVAALAKRSMSAICAEPVTQVAQAGLSRRHEDRSAAERIQRQFCRDA
jgi:hypothetical protein